MQRTIKIHYLFSGGETREVSEEDARRILSDFYNDPRGGFAVDLKTGKIIQEIESNVEEILLIEGIAEGG